MRRLLETLWHARAKIEAVRAVRPGSGVSLDASCYCYGLKISCPGPTGMIVADDNIIIPNNVAPPVGPATSREAVTAVAHFYRGEISRMISWRDRLDVTTNWAIGAVAAMLSISLSSPDSHHAVLLFAMLIVYILLVIEARRYRFFHVYRCRVRMLER